MLWGEKRCEKIKRESDGESEIEEEREGKKGREGNRWSGRKTEVDRERDGETDRERKDGKRKQGACREMG